MAKKCALQVTATSSNAGKVGATNCSGARARLKVEQTGTKEQIMGRNADYEIVVSNPGDTASAERHRDRLGPEARTNSIVAASGIISGSKPWTIERRWCKGLKQLEEWWKSLARMGMG